MGQPAAKLGDKVQGVDIHVVMIPTPGGPVPTPLPHPFNGTILQGTSTDVIIEKKPAATVDSMAINMPPHIPQGGPFIKPPSNQGKIMMGSLTVLIDGKPAARLGDIVQDCNDPIDSPTGTVVASSTVLIGGPPSPVGIRASGGAAITEQKFVPQNTLRVASPSTTALGSSTKKQSGKGSLVVSCVDQEGNAIPDCQYEMLLPGGEIRKGKTDSQGKIRAENVNPGGYEVRLYPKAGSASTKKQQQSPS